MTSRLYLTHVTLAEQRTSALVDRVPAYVSPRPTRVQGPVAEPLCLPDINSAETPAIVRAGMGYRGRWPRQGITLC